MIIKRQLNIQVRTISFSFLIHITQICSVQKVLPKNMLVMVYRKSKNNKGSI